MSGRRNLVFTNGEYYHILNRTIANEEIFLSKRNIGRFLNLMDYYRYPQDLSYSKYKKLTMDARHSYFDNYINKQPLIELYVYSLMPGHYHFSLKQLTDNGIKIFISNIQNAFAKYYNTKNDRDGGLFKRSFRGKRIESEEIFLHISRYIHLNPVTSYLMDIGQLEKNICTSYPYYVGKVANNVINAEFILSIVGSKDNYRKFIENHSDYQRKLKKIRTMLLE